MSELNYYIDSRNISTRFNNNCIKDNKLFVRVDYHKNCFNRDKELVLKGDDIDA